MKYKELLENVAIYGRGVFTISMSSEDDHQNFRKFINRNPQLFTEITGNRGHKKICILNRAGTKYLGLVNCQLAQSKEFTTLIDIATINSYLAELGKFEEYQLHPHQPLKLDEKVVGLVSTRWGPPPCLVDLLISTPSSAKSFFQKNRPSNLVIPRGVLRF